MSEAAHPEPIDGEGINMSVLRATTLYHRRDFYFRWPSESASAKSTLAGTGQLLRWLRPPL
jgi:hypothetical protein